MLWLITLLAAAGLPADVQRPCDTARYWEPMANPVPAALPPPPGDLGLRDVYDVELVELSEHFALRWGPDNPPSAEQRAHLLNAFEVSWEAEIVGMDHTAPYGTDTHHFNVYVGNTGGGTPPVVGAAGYYRLDSEGWPMIAIGRSQMNDPDRVKVTAAHELYHAAQRASGRFDGDPVGPSAWLFEATATAAAHEVFPDNLDYSDSLFAYAYHPHFRLDFYDRPGSGVVTEIYQYGAFIFPVHVADRTGSWQIIRDIWEDPGDDPDPLSVLASLLDQQGLDLAELWMDHVARNTVWDYPDGEAYLANVTKYDRLPQARNNDPIQLPGSGRDGWTNGPSDLIPGRFGSNKFVLIRPNEGVYTITIEAEPEGDYGGATRVGATLVLDKDEPEYRPLECSAIRCEGTWDDLNSAQNAYLVVGTWTDERESGWRNDVFRYRWRVSFYEPPVEAPAEPRACGCEQSGSSVAAAFWAGLLLLPLWRRRR